MKAEWKKGPDFAEYAEALGIETKQIMGVKAGGGEETTVLFSPDTEDDLDPETSLYAARMARDADGILVVGQVTLTSMNWSAMQAEIDRRLEGLGR